jgi:hypothetical protein
MKKLMIVAFVFAIALTASVAFAGDRCFDRHHNPCPCPDQSNSAVGVSNGISSQAISGGSSISGGYVGGGTIVSGASVSKVIGLNAINSNVKTGMSYGSSAQTNSAMFSDNVISSGSQSGVSTISGGYVGGGTIVAGASISKVKGINLINTNVKIGCGCYTPHCCD